MEQIQTLPKLFDFATMPKKTANTNGLTGHDIISVNQFDRDKLAYIFTRSHEMRELVERVGASDLLKGYVLACLFYEPSTRTSASFIAAMERLGGGVIPITQGVQFSSVSKGESLPDTIRTLEQYSDVIVLRHPEIGSAKLAADYASRARHQRRATARANIPPRRCSTCSPSARNWGTLMACKSRWSATCATDAPSTRSPAC